MLRVLFFILIFISFSTVSIAGDNTGISAYVIKNGSGTVYIPSSGSVTANELSYLSGASSNIQDQLNGILNNILPSQTGNNGKILSTDGSVASWISAPVTGVTSVTASSPLASSGGATPDISLGTVGFGNGGTGQTTQQLAINALAGAVTSGRYLRGNGTNILMSAIQAADVPTLNQNTTGTAADITATSNSSLTTLSALSLPGSQVSGDISGNAANVTGVVAIANGGTNNSSAYTSGSVVFSNGTSITQDNSNLFFDDTNNYLKIKNIIQLGSVDPFSRTQIWNYGTNATLRLGALAQDGDPSDVSSEGSIFYGANSQGTAINSVSGDFGYARVKADRFGLYTSISNTAGYYFRVDPTSLFLSDDSLAKKFEVTRSSGQIDTSMGLGVVLSNASGVLSNSVGSNGDVLTMVTGAPTWAAPAPSGVSSVTASSPLASSGGATPDISLTGIVPLANGGTNKNITASNGSISYSDADSLELSAVGVSGQALISGGAGAPSWYAPTIGSVLFAGTNGAISEDNSNLFWDNANKRLTVGSGINTFSVHGSSKGSEFTVSDQGGSNAYQEATHRHSATLTPVKSFLRSRGSEASPSIVQSGDSLAEINFLGYDGTDYEYGSKIESFVEGTPGTDDMPSSLVFSVSPDGGFTPAEALKISSNKTITMAGYGSGVLHSSSGGLLSSSSVSLTADVSGTLPESNGGTNQSTYSTGDIIYASAANTLSKLAASTDGKILTLVAGVPAWQTAPASGVTSVTASSPLASSGGATPDISLGTVGFGNGGTGQTTQQLAINALAGAVTSGQYLRGNGTNILMSAIQAADVPTLNQNTTGTAADITATSNSSLTTLSALSLPGSQVSGNISGNAANVTGVVAIANGGTNNSSAYTSGSVVFSNGTSLTQDNSNLFFDDTTNRLGIGTASPAYPIEIKSSTSSTGLSHTYTGAQSSSAGGSMRVVADSGAAMAAGNKIGSYDFYGAKDGSHTLNIGASIKATSSLVTWGAYAPTKLSFQLVPVLQSTLFDVLTLDSDLSATFASLINTGPGSSVRFRGASSGYVGLKAPSVAGSTEYTLPGSDGTINQALVTDGAGTLSWSSRRALQGTRQTGVSISASTQITPIVNVSNTVFVVGNGGPVTVTAGTPVVTSGMEIGQEVKICGTSDTNTVTYNNGNNLVLNGSAILGKDRCISLEYLGSDGTNSSWVENSARAF